MKTRLERFLFGIILAPLAPLAGLMAAWWGSYSLLPQAWIPVGTLAGLFAGIAADLFLLKGLVHRTRQLKPIFWAAVFLFYSVGVFGFFMGVPVFNALLAVPAGFVAAAFLVEKSPAPAQLERAARKTAWLTTGMLFLICVASATFALLSSSTPSDLKGMLGLPFEVTQAMVIGLIGVGGVGLLSFNWILAWGSTRLAYKFLQPQEQQATVAG